MRVGKLSRRRLMAATAVAGMVGAPFVRRANAAGSLSIGLWDHWVPGANDVQSAIIKEWADREKVEVKVDYITSQGNKLLITLAAESQAKSGHDIMEFTNWEAAQYSAGLEPVDDVVKNIVAKNGPIDPAVEYLGKFEGRWAGVPMTRGTLLLGCCTRFDLMKEHAGVDVQALYPAGKPPNDASWTWDSFLVAAEKCQKAGFGFGLPLGNTTDTNQWVGALFLAYGAELMDAKGNITVQSDAVRQVLEYGKKLAAFCPADAPAWDDASNNKWLLSGKGALIFNPPSAWAVSKRDAPQVAEKCWTIGFPKGPKGRFNPVLPRFYGLWSFSKNKPAAKSLLEYLAMRPVAEKQVAASQGYDIPPYPKFNDFKTWEEEGPPKGTLYHYPIKGGDQKAGVVCSPAPPLIAAQMWAQAFQSQMIVRQLKGEPMEKTLAWAASELEGLKRT
ncbi:extracellular solute-binding protein [Enhydrobacter sp.]|jgi:ABC-type glycerol-3-phosphate transport system substrate-binding protein|uniref:ABC transporter substrate-binding protein n=1 Tax=Enhydrobacter sp. TaxID=1894999 RepID=UPI00262D8880|nr:extracellular solute-binding protein [Enhydrobacter sp.]WIM09354.1 MAG: ABC transporter, substrate-binding protein (cluster 1, maltose/g3p/polyamine/iron) [Enhydrobacter sp.]